MPIYQTTRFVCDICKREVSETKEVDLHSEDNVFIEGWDYTPDYDKLACPVCSFQNKIQITVYGKGEL